MKKKRNYNGRVFKGGFASWRWIGKSLRYKHVYRFVSPCGYEYAYKGDVARSVGGEVISIRTKVTLDEHEAAMQVDEYLLSIGEEPVNKNSIAVFRRRHGVGLCE